MVSSLRLPIVRVLFIVLVIGVSFVFANGTPLSPVVIAQVTPIPPDNILFVRNGDIYTMGPDGLGVTPITNSPQSEFNARKSPDGTKIAFSYPFESSADIYVINADGSNRIQITDGLPNAYVGGWSPDGSKIVFHGPGVTSPAALYLIDVDASNQGSNLTPLSMDLDFPANAAWCSGNKIVFDHFLGAGNYEIYRIDADDTDGSTLMRLTNDPTSRLLKKGV